MNSPTTLKKLEALLRRRPAARPNRTRLTAELLETRNLLTTIFTTEHIHLEANFADGAWGPFQVNDTTHGVNYDPSDVLLYIDPAATQQTQPAGWTFIGAGDGNPYYKMDSSESSNLTSLAISLEHIPSNTFFVYQPNDPRITRPGEWVKFAMIDVQGPGFVSSWQNTQPVPDQWWMSSYDGGRTLESVEYLEPGGHVHYNWGFTQIGIYQVTFQASAFVGDTGLPVRSDYVTLTFGVGDTGESAVPGLSSAPLAALATAPRPAAVASPANVDVTPAAFTALPAPVQTPAQANGSPAASVAGMDHVFAAAGPTDWGFAVLGLTAPTDGAEELGVLRV